MLNTLSMIEKPASQTDSPIQLPVEESNNASRLVAGNAKILFSTPVRTERSSMLDRGSSKHCSHLDAQTRRRSRMRRRDSAGVSNNVDNIELEVAPDAAPCHQRHAATLLSSRSLDATY